VARHLQGLPGRSTPPYASGLHTLSYTPALHSAHLPSPLTPSRLTSSLPASLCLPWVHPLSPCPAYLQRPRATRATRSRTDTPPSCPVSACSPHGRPVLHAVVPGVGAHPHHGAPAGAGCAPPAPTGGPTATRATAMPFWTSWRPTTLWPSPSRTLELASPSHVCQVSFPSTHAPRRQISALYKQYCRRVYHRTCVRRQHCTAQHSTAQYSLVQYSVPYCVCAWLLPLRAVGPGSGTRASCPSSTRAAWARAATTGAGTDRCVCPPGYQEDTLSDGSRICSTLRTANRYASPPHCHMLHHPTATCFTTPLPHASPPHCHMLHHPTATCFTTPLPHASPPHCHMLHHPTATCFTTPLPHTHRAHALRQGGQGGPLPGGPASLIPPWVWDRQGPPPCPLVLAFPFIPPCLLAPMLLWPAHAHLTLICAFALGCPCAQYFGVCAPGPLFRSLCRLGNPRAAELRGPRGADVLRGVRRLWAQRSPVPGAKPGEKGRPQYCTVLLC